MTAVPAQGMLVRPAPPQHMTIVYDDTCPFCVRCADWLRDQQPAIALAVVPASDPTIRSVHGSVPGFGGELLVAAGNGEVWIGSDAFIAALWCLVAYRHLSTTLTGPTAHRMARTFFRAVSSNRGKLGAVLGLEDCEGGTCSRH